MFDIGSYRYQCVDHSYLDPYLRKFFAKPLHKIIPNWFPANGISLLGHLCVWSVFFLSTRNTSPSQVFACLVLLQLYMILDVLDGMQARVTKTSSPLGEYIDHGGDAYNCGLIIYSSLAILNVTSTWFYLVLIGLGMVTFSLVSIEKKVTGSCVFPKIGNVELQTFLILFFAALQMPCIGKPLSTIWCGFSIATWILLSIAVIGGSLSIVNSLKRIAKLPSAYYFFLIQSSFLIYVLVTQSIPCTLSVLILIFYMATYNSEILFSHLTKQKIPMPNLIEGLMITLLFVINLLQLQTQINFFFAFLVYLIFSALWRINHVFCHYGQFWVWVNHNPKITG